MLEDLTSFDQRYAPEAASRRVLLVNPPVYDIRFPWSNRQQPVSLLQLATLLHRYQCDIRLLDAVTPPAGTRLQRHRVRKLPRGNTAINYWRYGTPTAELRDQLFAWKKQGWQPDDVYVESFTTIWWEGIHEVIEVIREAFSQCRIIVYGTYPAIAPEEAQRACQADVFVAGSIADIVGLPLDLSLYASRPRFTHLAIGSSVRPAQDLIDEFLAKAKSARRNEWIRHFAFVDHDVLHRFPDHIKSVLQTVVDQKLHVSFYALGNIYPRDIIDDPEIAPLLFRAGFKQIVFADDREISLTEDARASYLEVLAHAVEQCIAAGFRWRTESLSASFCLGRPGEDLADAATFMTRIAHSRFAHRGALSTVSFGICFLLSWKGSYFGVAEWKTFSVC